MAPATYKAKIAGGNEIKFKFLRMVAGWNMQTIKLSHIELMDLPQPYVVQDLIPYVRAVYKVLIQVYYYGESKIPKIIKEIYTDEIAYPDAPQDKLSSMAKEAITQWLYIQNEIIKRLYPLLMRMCSDTYEEYPDFFKTKVADILKFVGLHKYDLLLPEKDKPAGTDAKAEAKEKPAVPKRPVKGVKDGKQYTIPVDAALEAVRSGSNPELTTRQKHTRECFVVAKEGADLAQIEHDIKTMPNYFSDYDTTVHFISEEELKRDHAGIPHGGFVLRTGKTGLNGEHNHVIEYSLKLDSNPEFTACVLVAYARAAYRMNQEGMKGCKTVFDVAPAYLSPMTAEEMRSKLL